MKPDFHLNFRPLFALARILALVMLLLIPLPVVFVIAPPPDTLTGFLIFFSGIPFLGLLSLDFIYLFNNAIDHLSGHRGAVIPGKTGARCCWLSSSV